MTVLICPKLHETWWKSIQSPLFWKQSLHCLTPKKRGLWEGGIGHGPYWALRIAMAHKPTFSVVQIHGVWGWIISLFCLWRIAFLVKKDYPSCYCDTCVLLTPVIDKIWWKMSCSLSKNSRNMSIFQTCEDFIKSIIWKQKVVL